MMVAATVTSFLLWSTAEVLLYLVQVDANMKPGLSSVDAAAAGPSGVMVLRPPTEEGRPRYFCVDVMIESRGRSRGTSCKEGLDPR